MTSLSGFLRYGRSAAVSKLCALLVAVSCLSGAATAQSVTIAALGDSLVQGYGLAPEAGLVPQLEGWLRQNGAKVTVINAGVSGDTTAGGLARLEWTLTPEVKGLIVALGGNDLLRGMDPAASRANLTAIVEGATGRGVPVLLVGIAAPGNYGPDYKAAFDAIFADLGKIDGVTAYPGFFDSIGTAGDDAALAGLMQGDGIHPNAKGVERVIADFGPAVLEWLRGLDLAG